MFMCLYHKHLPTAKLVEELKKEIAVVKEHTNSEIRKVKNDVKNHINNEITKVKRHISSEDKKLESRLRTWLHSRGRYWKALEG